MNIKGLSKKQLKALVERYDFSDKFYTESYEMCGYFQSVLDECFGFNKPEVYFSGFWSQGDGACFTCKTTNLLKWIETTKNKSRFRSIYKQMEKENLYVYVSIIHHGRYYHEDSTIINFEYDNYSRIKDSALEELEKALKVWYLDYCKNVIYNSLEKAYIEKSSDKYILEFIKENLDDIPQLKGGIQKVYKITNRYSKSLYANGNLCLKYEIGKKTFPKLGKIFAFESLESVIRFLKNKGCNEFFVFECKAKCVKLLLNKLPNSITEESFWEDENYFKSVFQNRYSNVPDGTIFCDWVKPLKDVTNLVIESMGADL